MEVVKYGRSEMVLPYIDNDLDVIDDLGCDKPLSDYLYADHKVRHISISGGRLTSGQIRQVEAESATFTGVR